MLRALHALGFDWEAFEYFALHPRRGRRRARKGGKMFELQIMYGIGGETDLTESTLDHLSGYGGAKPVRIGNGAYDQQQHDVWGMLMDSICEHAAPGRPDPGRWSGRASRGSSTPRSNVRPSPTRASGRCAATRSTSSRRRSCAGWRPTAAPPRPPSATTTSAPSAGRHAADEIKAEVLAKGVSDRGVFRQHYDTDDLDASLLLIPIMGFLPEDDERVKATVLAIADELTKDDLVLRYRVESTDDGLSGEEGTFTICSFWLVSALALIDEVERARKLFSKLLSFAGPLLLYAEEIDTTTGQHLGNFPQAFTHLALIDAATRLIASEAPDR